MRISTTLVATALFALVAAAPEPQTGAQTTAAIEALSSYLAAQLTNPTAISIASALATDPSALSAIESLDASVDSALTAGKTLAPPAISVFPSAYQSYFSSIYAAELSIAAANGFAAAASSEASSVGVAAPTGTSSGGVGPTAVWGVGAMAGVALGVVGFF